MRRARLILAHRPRHCGQAKTAASHPAANALRPRRIDERSDSSLTVYGVSCRVRVKSYPRLAIGRPFTPKLRVPRSRRAGIRRGFAANSYDTPRSVESSP